MLRNKRYSIWLNLVTLWLIVAIPTASTRLQGPAGTLDPHFGLQGRVVTRFDRYSDAHNLAFQADGKMVVAGATHSDNLPYGVFTVTRYNGDGTLDTSFDADGKVTTSINPLGGSAWAVAVQSDGKIVVAGSAFAADYSTTFALVRYNTNGSLDGTFGAGGIVTTPMGSLAGIFSVAIQPDGKIVAAGYATVNSAAVFGLARYNPNGSLDTSFGSGGIVAVTQGNLSNAAFQADGKIVAVGYSFVGSNRVFMAVRYNTDGSLDTSFGSGGMVVAPIGIRSVVIQPNNKIVVAGFSGSQAALARYNPDGSLDTSFGSGVTIITNAGTSITDVALQADGKIVTLGFGTLNAWTVARYNVDASLDASFGTGGVVSTSFLQGRSVVSEAIGIQADGKIVAIGEFSNGPNHTMALARYLAQ